MAEIKLPIHIEMTDTIYDLRRAAHSVYFIAEEIMNGSLDPDLLPKEFSHRNDLERQEAFINTLADITCSLKAYADKLVELDREKNKK